MGGWPTTFLFADNDLVAGAASVLDMAGLYPAYNRSNDESEADAKAILNDWYNVGKDLIDAIPDHVEKQE